jgi:hypothetical protein
LGCPSGTTCYYRVRSTNVGGTCLSADSAAVSAAACKLPGVPTGLNKAVGAPTPGSGKVTLTWTAPSNANSYEILRSTTQGSGYAAFANNTSTTTSFTDSGLINDTSYFYVIKARNGGASCASDSSAEISAIPRACQIFPGNVVSYSFNTKSAVCFTTCWDMAAGTWNWWNFGGRSGTVNGRPVTSGGDPGSKSNGAYTFSITAGDDSNAGINWWSTGPTIQAHDCP